MLEKGENSQGSYNQQRDNSQGSNDHQMVDAITPSLPKMFESSRDDNQKEIVAAKQESHIPDADATNDDQPIPKTSDHSETNDYEGFLDMGFMTLDTIPFSIVYPDSYFEGEIPQGTHNDIKYKEEQVNPRKRKDSFSRVSQGR
ncbi:unnamed protein product [Lactuca saligna]|uniref:Uncharacterized protein n=1 Tax=Lactuca saligna TaxID=75948 RepID=A0AA35YWW1_LACSI|nr:unnamed protein product [Lactuca saligna]